MSVKLARLLYDEKVIAETIYNEAMTATNQGKEKSPVVYLIEKRQISETKLLNFLTQKFSLPSINLNKFEISPDIVNLLSPDKVQKFRVIPIQSNRGTLVVVTWDPTNLEQMDQLKFVTKMNVEAVLTTVGAFEASLQKYYGAVAFVGQAVKQIDKDLQAGGTDHTSVDIQIATVHDVDVGAIDASEAPIISIVNGILREAFSRKASDIHVEPYEKKFRVRMRVDGVLTEITQLPIQTKRAVVARLKIMAHLDIAEARMPQDGRIKLKVSGNDVDLRVNTVPTVYGEKVVMRLLNKSSLQLDFSKLGFEPEQMAMFKRGIYAPNGMVLVTGPTGSGKTTTLYSALSELNGVGDNISTAEDPVEYNLDGVNQIQVNKDIGLTFANVLRALLRQDPDTILVGEIRDYETAEVAVQAALTGHLVLSTLHTNDAPSTIVRLMNMGLEPFLVVASLNTIIAQRLLRRICMSCRTPANVPKEKLIELGFSKEQAETMMCVQGKGCSQCGKTGYKGRVAIYEVLDFTPTLKEMVLNGSSALDLKRQAAKEGMKSLRMSALTKVAEGVTTLEEALSNTMEN